ncbi:hypothetical protein [Paenibacillus sp. GCM10012303]|uniref:hypothetical protein n=1 Tax=Paenibacillus sp. GCM10012303 TaxID=3317340 RepID=UPI0036D4150F
MEGFPAAGLRLDGNVSLGNGLRADRLAVIGRHIGLSRGAPSGLVPALHQGRNGQ